MCTHIHMHRHTHTCIMLPVHIPRLLLGEFYHCVTWYHTLVTSLRCLNKYAGLLYMYIIHVCLSNNDIVASWRLNILRDKQ